MARGGDGPCTKFCATCEASYDACKADKDASTGQNRNVVSCDQDKAIICRYDVGLMNASNTCKSHGGDDDSGSAGCPASSSSYTSKGKALDLMLLGTCINFLVNIMM